MAITRLDYYDAIRITYVQDIATAKTNIANIFEGEMVYAIAEASLLIKNGGKLYKVPLTEVV